MIMTFKENFLSVLQFLCIGLQHAISIGSRREKHINNSLIELNLINYIIS